jgi:hypothetical protein
MLCEQGKIGEDGVLAEYLRLSFIIYSNISELQEA